MNRRTLLGGIVALPFVVLGVNVLRRVLASDQTHVRWVIEDMLEGFNRAEMGPILRGIAPDFIDGATGVRREDLRGALIQSFFEDLDPSSREYLYRAELFPEELVIEIEGDGRAAVALHVRFLDRRRGEEREFWDARIAGRMQRGDDGWQWVRTDDVNHADRRRMR